MRQVAWGVVLVGLAALGSHHTPHQRCSSSARGCCGAETARAFISHDGWIDLSHREAETVAEWKRELEEAGHVILTDDAAGQKAFGR